MFKKIFPLIVLLALVLASCAPAAATQSTGSRSAEGGAPSAPEQQPAAKPQAPNFSSDNSGGSGTTDQQVTERLVIRNANLSIVVDDPAAAMDSIIRLANTMNGFVVTSNLYKTTVRDSLEVQAGDITIRVPAAQLDSAMSQIKALVKDPKTDVLTENVSGQDVTKEYTDLNSQLKNLQDTEAQLREIMKSATKTEDVLAVYNQISQIHGQIEVIQGQINYYKEAAAMSAIAVKITAAVAVEPVTVSGWQPLVVASQAANALVGILKFLVNVAIYLVIVILPIALLIFVPLYILWRVLRRNANKPRVQPAPPAPPAAQM